MRIATRASALALAQARTVAAMLGADVELVPMTSAGDVAGGAPQASGTAGDKARWVSTLEGALLRGEVDLAVHSAKDVPYELPEGLALVGAPAREDPRDALCGAPSLDALPEGARVGTASVRRAAGLLALRPDLVISELRGNVDTRLARLAVGDFDAIVLALAGLRRLGREDAADGVLDELVPCAGQGTLVLEARADDERAREAVAAISDDATMSCLRAERALVGALEADCDTPVGAHARADGDGLVMRAFVGAADGSAWVTDEWTGPHPAALGALVAERLRAAGADAVLGR